jgi:hypothetical protein
MFVKGNTAFGEAPLETGVAISKPVDDVHPFYARSLPSGARSSTLPKPLRRKKPRQEERRGEEKSEPEPRETTSKESGSSHSLGKIRLTYVRDHKNPNIMRLLIQLLDRHYRPVQQKERVRILDPEMERGYATRKTRDDGTYIYQIKRITGLVERERRVEVEVLGTGIRNFTTVRF